MTIRRGLGLLLLLAAAYAFWEAARAVLILVDRGSSFSDAIFNPPASFLKLTGGGLALLGGALAAWNKPLGGLIGLIGALIFATVPLLVLRLSPAPMGVMRDAIPALIMIIAAIALMTQRRNA